MRLLPLLSLQGKSREYANKMQMLRSLFKFAGLLGLSLSLAWAEPPLVLPEEEETQAAPEEDKPNQSGPYRRGPFGGPTQSVFNAGDDEGFGLGTALPDPSAFEGADRTDVVLPGSRFVDVISLIGRYGIYLSPRQRIMLTGSAGSSMLGLDLDYSFTPEGMDGYFSAFINEARSQNGSFLFGTDVGLPGDNKEPWLHRTSTGFGYSTDPSQPLSFSTALLYQNLSVHSGPFSGRLAPIDRLGNPLLVSGRTLDEMLQIRFAGLHMDLDALDFPKDGHKFRFSAEQAIPIGASQISFTRFNANLVKYQPIRIFGESEQTLVMSLQAGTMTGTPPPYEAYNMGGPNSIRGYQLGEVGGGTSFLQTTAELRVPVGDLSLFGREVPIRLNAFVDWGTGFQSASRVFGQPALVRDKPDSALGYGAGIQALSEFGLIRIEAGFGAGSRSQVNFLVGDRF